MSLRTIKRKGPDWAAKIGKLGKLQVSMTRLLAGVIKATACLIMTDDLQTV